jgi:cyclopropane-fatty-acyl-phospholipid synthase
MTMTNKQAPAMNRKLSLAETLALFTEAGKPPLKFTPYDGSSAGPDDAALGVDLLTRTALRISARPSPGRERRRMWPG